MFLAAVRNRDKSGSCTLCFAAAALADVSAISFPIKCWLSSAFIACASDIWALVLWTLMCGHAGCSVICLHIPAMGQAYESACLCLSVPEVDHPGTISMHMGRVAGCGTGVGGG